MKTIGRIRGSKRKKKVLMTFKSSTKRGRTCGESACRLNGHDSLNNEENENTNGEVMTPLCGQANNDVVNGGLP